MTFDYIFDPSKVTVGEGDILVHYTDPKVLTNGDIITPFRDQVGNVITYSVKLIRAGRIVWTFVSDYVRQPGTFWEPIFDMAVNGNTVYVAGAVGCAWLLDVNTGLPFYNACPYDAPANPTGYPVWISSPFTIDANGNVFWTIRTNEAMTGVKSLLAKLLPDNATVLTVDFASLTGDATRQAAMNASPAVTADGQTIYVATNLPSQLGAKLIALDQDFNPLWVQALNHNTPATATTPACHEAILINSGTSSPVALPDGGVAIGGWNAPGVTAECPSTSTECPVSEGYYYGFSAAGDFRGCYNFGWDDTMGVITLNGTTYLVGKHNHYTRPAMMGGPFYEVVMLNASTMQKVWSFINPEMPTHEWCIDAPTLFKTTDMTGQEQGWFVVPSEGGTLYRVRLMSSPSEVTSARVGGVQNAAYVPTVSTGGTAYTISHGHLIGVSGPATP